MRRMVGASPMGSGRGVVHTRLGRALGGPDAAARELMCRMVTFGAFRYAGPRMARQFLQHRVAGHRVLRLIQKWLRAGVSEAVQGSRRRWRAARGCREPIAGPVYLHDVSICGWMPGASVSRKGTWWSSALPMMWAGFGPAGCRAVLADCETTSNGSGWTSRRRRHTCSNDHAASGHLRPLGTFRLRVIRRWRRQLRLRSQKTRMNWQRFGVLLRRRIPHQRILQPAPRVPLTPCLHGTRRVQSCRTYGYVRRVPGDQASPPQLLRTKRKRVPAPRTIVAIKESYSECPRQDPAMCVVIVLGDPLRPAEPVCAGEDRLVGPWPPWRGADAEYPARTTPDLVVIQADLALHRFEAARTRPWWSPSRPRRQRPSAPTGH